MKKLLLTSSLIILLMTGSKAQWTAQPSNISANHYVQFIDAVDTNVVWGLVSDPANQLTPIQEFTKTVDGGNLWIANPINNAVGLSPSGIYALNADTAWVAMFNGTSGGGKILRTNDGGVNWTWQSTATFTGPAGFPNWVYFFNSDEGICMGDPNGGYFEIYTTTDGGANWVRVLQPNIPAPQANEFGITSVYTTQGDSTLWFGTSLGRILKTTDRGQNWTAANTPYAGSYIGDIAFRDANNGIASNGSAGALPDMIRTTDGGDTWNIISANTVNIGNKVMSYVPGTDSTYFLSSPQAGGGTAFTVNDANSWVLVDNLIHSDIEFVNPTTGWTGSNELNGPMFKWSGPIIQSCISLLGPLEFASPDSVCNLDSVVYSIHIDKTNDQLARMGFNAVFYDEFNTQVGAQTIQDLAAAGFPNNFVPDPGFTNVGTYYFTIFFTIAPTNEFIHFDIQIFPTQCSDDTSNFANNTVFQDVSTCATVISGTNNLTFDFGTCIQTGLVNYTVAYSVNGGPQIPGSVFTCTGNTGLNSVTFYVDNGVCVKAVSAQINCTGVGVEEINGDGISIYPNPVNDMLFISNDTGTEIDKLTITDITGRIILNEINPVTNAGEIRIATNNWNNGIYLLNILKKGADAPSVTRFVKM